MVTLIIKREKVPFKIMLIIIVLKIIPTQIILMTIIEMQEYSNKEMEYLKLIIKI